MRFFIILLFFVFFFLSCKNNNNSNEILLDPKYTYTFEVEFINLWNPEKQPTDYPTNAAWGTFTGLTHTDNVNILMDEGTNASPGLKTYAETGNNAKLLSELNQIINTEGASIINQPGGMANDDIISFQFTTSGNYPYVTILSKITPSPDWFVAVRNINLHVIALGGSTNYHVTSYDVGSKSGKSYTSSGTSTSEPLTVKENYPLINANGVFEQLGIIKITFKDRK